MKNINVVVKNEFLDRYTGIKHKPGKKMTITDARYREIKRSGDFVEIAQAKETPETPKDDQKK